MRPEKRSAVTGTFGRIADDNTPAVHTPLVPASRATSRKPGRINLKAVGEVLQERGLDPTEEIINIIDGVDEHGRHLIDPDTRLRILNELLQYTQPKLKSIEIKAKVAATAFDVNDEQAKRIAEEFLRASTTEAA
jgi:hypothetical protein